MTMLTYESVWLENDQLLKVQLFLENIGVSNYVISRIEEEGVSTITVPEISEENWNKVEDFEYTLLRGDWEEEKDPQTLQQLQKNLAMGIFGQTKQQAHEVNKCISCNQPIYYSDDDTDVKPGCIYSMAGKDEYYLSGLCEYCFDKAFDETTDTGKRELEIEELESFTENHQ